MSGYVPVVVALAMLPPFHRGAAAEPAAVAAPIHRSASKAVDAFFAAIAANDAATVERLIKQGVDLNARDASGATPLVAAVEAGNVDALRRLLDAGANANLGNAAGASALSRAIWHDRGDLAALLLDAGADPLHGRTAQEPALVAAAEWWRPQAIALLLRAGVDPLLEWSNGRLIHYAAVHGDRDLIALLLGRGESIDRIASRDDATPLIRAAMSGSDSAVRVVLEFKPQIDVRTRGGRTALMQAAQAGKVTIVELLLRAGADPNLKGTVGETAYLLAGRNGHLPVLAVLRAAGATPVPIRLPLYPGPASPLPAPRQFALAMAALECAFHQVNPRMVPDRRFSPVTAARWLKQRDIADAADLRRQLDALLVGGQAADPSNPVARLSEAEYQARIDAVLDDPVKVLALRQARQAAGGARPPTRAWNLCHHNFLAIFGVMAGWLPLDEAWSRMVAAAEALRTEAGSWEEIAPALVDGLGASEHDRPRAEALVQLLLNKEDRASAWTSTAFMPAAK